MPVKIEKKKGGRCYKVSTPGSTKAKCTTKKKAEAQRRLINAVENNPGFRARLRGAVTRN